MRKLIFTKQNSQSQNTSGLSRAGYLPHQGNLLATLVALVVPLGLGGLLGPHGGLVLVGVLVVRAFVPQGTTGLVMIGLGVLELGEPGTRNGLKQ